MLAVAVDIAVVDSVAVGVDIDMEVLVEPVGDFLSILAVAEHCRNRVRAVPTVFLATCRDCNHHLLLEQYYLKKSMITD